MSTKWVGPAAINYRWGDQNTCESCYGRAEVVVHENYDYLKLTKEQKDGVDEAKLARIFKVFLKVCDERFLCRRCFESNYHNNPSKYDENGQSVFTSKYISDWRKKPTTLLDDVLKS